MGTIKKYLDEGYNKLIDNVEVYESVTLQNVTKTVNTQGDLVATVNSTSSINAIIQLLDEIERDEMAGLNVNASHRAYIDPSVTVTEDFRVVRDSVTYEIIKIEEAPIGSDGDNVYISLLLEKI